MVKLIGLAGNKVPKINKPSTITIHQNIFRTGRTELVEIKDIPMFNKNQSKSSAKATSTVDKMLQRMESSLVIPEYDHSPSCINERLSMVIFMVSNPLLNKPGHG